MGDFDRTVDRLDAWFEGDNDALGELLKENLDWMTLYARRELDPNMRKRLDSVDVVQEGVARLLRRGPRYAPRSREEFRAHRVADMSRADAGRKTAREGFEHFPGEPSQKTVRQSCDRILFVNDQRSPEHPCRQPAGTGSEATHPEHQFWTVPDHHA